MSLPGDPAVVDLIAKALLAVVAALSAVCVYFLKGIAEDMRELRKQHDQMDKRMVRVETTLDLEDRSPNSRREAS